MSPRRNGLPTLRELADRLARLERAGLGQGGGNPAFEAATDAALDALADEDVVLGDLIDDLDLLVDQIDATIVVLNQRTAVAVEGLVFPGSSWAAEIDVNGQRLVAQNPDTWWPRRIAKRCGFADNRYALPAHGLVAAGVNAQPQIGRGGFPSQYEGIVDSIYMRNRGVLNPGGGANGRTLSLWTNRTLNALAPPRTIGVLSLVNATIPANSLTHIPFTNIYDFEQMRVIPYDGLFWTSNVINGVTHQDDGATIFVVINNGELSIPARGSSMYCQTGNRAGGWSEIAHLNTIRVRSAGQPGEDWLGQMVAVNPVARLWIFTAFQNDFGMGADEALVKETTRYVWSVPKWLWRAGCTSTDACLKVGTGTSTGRVNGDGGGIWTTSTATPPAGVLGTLDFFAGDPGTAVKASWPIEVAASYKAGIPVGVPLVCTPCRTTTVGLFNGVAQLSNIFPVFSIDDVGAPVAGANIPANTVITGFVSANTVNISNPATATATVPATIGIGGYSGTILIDGSATLPPGVKINGGLDNTFTTHQVSGFNGNGASGANRTEPGFPAVRLFPMVKIITGLSDGAHVIRGRIDSLGTPSASFHRCYQDGAWLEANAPISTPLLQCRQPVLTTTSSTYSVVMNGAPGAANLALRNAWQTDIEEEFASVGRSNIGFVPLDEVLDDQIYFDSGGSHLNALGLEAETQAVWRAMQALPVTFPAT